MDTSVRTALKSIPREAPIGNNEETEKTIENFITSRIYPVLPTMGHQNPKLYFWQWKIRGKTYEIDVIVDVVGDTSQRNKKR